MKIQGLNIYKQSITLTAEVYKLTKILPDEEKFGLVSQMRRAVVSVGANISEGYGRVSVKDNIRFCRIANASLIELRYLFEVCYELKFLDTLVVQDIDEKINTLGIKLNNYIKSLNRKF
jgi:four helix bundle protein